MVFSCQKRYYDYEARKNPKDTNEKTPVQQTHKDFVAKNNRGMVSLPAQIIDTRATVYNFSAPSKTNSQ